MLQDLINSQSTVILSTGNVLNVLKKAGQKPTEELVECLKSALSDPTSSKTPEGGIKIAPLKDDLQQKIQEHNRDNIKIGAKVFLNKNCEKNLQSAIDNLLAVLNVDNLDNLILAYHPKCGLRNKSESSIIPVTTNGETNGVINWGGGDVNALNDIKTLWKSLEKFSLERKIEQLGIADLDADSLKELYSICQVYPTIAQINLSACCVVPPALQSFCNENDIQLLTHSDPEELLSKSLLTSTFNIPNYQPSWIIRYQVHVKCRGVLAAKGFIMGLEKP